MLKQYIFDLKEGIIISLKALMVNKMRAILTTLGIIVGIVAVTTMATAIVGLREAFVSSISFLGNDVLYVDKFEWFGGEDWRSYRNRKDIDYDQYEKLKNMLTHYKAISPNRRSRGRTIKYKQRSAESTVVFGTNEQYISTSGALPDKGRFMNEFEVRAGRRVCVIGKDIEEALFNGLDPINKHITMSGVPLKIIGVLEKQGSGFLGAMSLDGQVIMPLKVFQRIFGSRRKSLRIDVKVNDVSEIEDVREEIIAAMRTIRKVPPGAKNDFAVNRQDVFTDVYDKTVGVIAIAGILITALSLFVGAIGIMNIMFVSVTERTREIGIRKAIGAKTWSILLQFLSEATIICIIGGILGLAISFPLSLIINQFLPTTMPLDIVGISLLISALVGIVSGFLPAYKASRLNPVDALRYE